MVNLNKFVNDFDFFISERFQSNLKELNKNSSYKNEIDTYYNLEKELLNSISENEKNILEK